MSRIRTYGNIEKSCRPAVANLVDHMLTKDPATRIANGNQVVRGIIGCLQDVKTMGESR